MVLMKPVKGRKRGGNSAPNKRMPFPDVSQENLDAALHSYCRSMGIKEAFNMYQYTNLQPQQAEHAPSISKLTRLLDVLLTISSSAQIKYKALKQSFTYLIQAWGLQLLKPHWNMEDNLLAGRAADSVGVLLKHWRRCSNSEAAWGKLVSRLDESETLALERLRKKTNEVGKQQGPKKRQLKLNHSEVSKDSKGWPNMVAQSIDSEAEDEETEQEELESEGGSPNTSDESPPLA